MKKKLTDIIVSVTIMALLLTGAVPCFAWEAAAETEQQVLPAIEIDSSDAPDIHATSAIVMDLDTGTVLYEKNADKSRQPASITKILTGLVVAEELDMDQVVTVPEDVETTGSVIWLEPGEKITVEELFYGMMMESGNDAAEVLGLTAGGGDLDTFSDMMNQRARECGATHTDFRNPNGLNEDPDHLNYTTARDLALISKEAMNNPMFRKVVGTVRHTIPKTNKSKKRSLRNSNACLWQDDDTTEVNGKEVPFKYKGCTGIKTGFTSDAGFCYVGSAKRKNSEFVVVIMNTEESEQRYQDAISLWDYAFSKYETYPVLSAGDTAGVHKVRRGALKEVKLGTKEDLGVTIEKGTADSHVFTTEFRFDNDKITAPVGKGEKLGQVLAFNAKGRLVGVQNLYALNAVEKGGPLSYIGIADEELPEFFAIVAGVLAVLIILLLIRKRRRRNMRRRGQAQMQNELSQMRTSGVGMTPAELKDVTGIDEFQPIRKGPNRISSEELNAWTSTRKRQKSDRHPGTRFGGRTPRGGYGKTRQADQPANADRMPKMKITPKTSFMSGTIDARTGKPLNQKPMTDEELFAMFESTRVRSADEPRRHGKLTEKEREEVYSDKKLRREKRRDQKKRRR